MVEKMTLSRGKTGTLRAKMAWVQNNFEHFENRAAEIESAEKWLAANPCRRGESFSQIKRRAKCVDLQLQKESIAGSVKTLAEMAAKIRRAAL